MVNTDSYSGATYKPLVHDDFDHFVKKKKAGSPPLRASAPGQPAKKRGFKVTGIAKKSGLFGIAPAVGNKVRAVKAAKAAKKAAKPPVAGFGFLNKHNQKKAPLPPPVAQEPATTPEEPAVANPDAENLAQGASSDLQQINDSTSQTPPPAEEPAANVNDTSAEPPSETQPADETAPEPTAAEGEDSGYDDDYARYDRFGRKFVSQYYGYDANVKTSLPNALNTPESQPPTERPNKKETGVTAGMLLGLGAMLFVVGVSIYIVAKAPSFEEPPTRKTLF